MSMKRVGQMTSRYILAVAIVTVVILSTIIPAHATNIFSM